METKKIWKLILVLFPLVGLTACSSDSTPTDTVAVVVVVGENSAADRVEEIPLGSEVTLQFTNPDADDEYHVHGHDLGAGITKKGDTKTFTFTADKAGDYEVESHISEIVLVILRVS